MGGALVSGDVLDRIDNTIEPKKTDRRDRVRGSFREGGRFAPIDLPDGTLCSIGGCTSPVQVKSRGWCERHYTRWKRHGDPTFTHRRRSQPSSAIRSATVEDPARFNRLVSMIAGAGSSHAQACAARVLVGFGKKVVVASNGCWHWAGSRPGEYGHVTVDGKRHQAHRWLWEQVHGPVEAHLVMDHQCHNRALVCNPAECLHRQCVNPDHLEPTTQRLNCLRGKTLQAAFAARTHCDYGHEFDAPNTQWRTSRGKGAGRVCGECRRLATPLGDPSRTPCAPDEIATMRELRKQGFSVRRIALTVHRSTSTVLRHCAVA